MPQPFSPIRVFVQARMSSSRFPGKVLAPVIGKPMIVHLLDRLHLVMAKEDVIVLTSTDLSDDPLDAYLNSINVPVFRGDLLNTFLRFRTALLEYPCKQFFRICGDSPLFNEQLITMMLKQNETQTADIHTNLFPRTFPKGQSIELINSDVFMGIDIQQLTSDECEHVTPHFYSNTGKFTIENLKNPNPSASNMNAVIDTIEDLKQIEENWKLNKIE